MKTIAKLSREELKQITGGLFHYYCICENGKTMNGSASDVFEMAEVVFRVCGDNVEGECFSM